MFMVTAQTDTGALSQPNVGEENAMVCRESSSAQLSFDLHTKRRNAVSLTVKESVLLRMEHCTMIVLAPADI